MMTTLHDDKNQQDDGAASASHVDEPSKNLSNERLPKWVYQQTSKSSAERDAMATIAPALDNETTPNLGTYSRKIVTNLDNSNANDPMAARAYFDYGLRLMLAFQHQLAAKFFLTAAQLAPYCALAHGLVALCHGPNYNFKGEPYYQSSFRQDEATKDDHLCIFPSQHVADRHSKLAMETIEHICNMHKENHKEEQTTEIAGLPEMIPEEEVQLLSAIRILTCQPGVDPTLATDLVGRPYANAMRKLFRAFSEDAEIVFFFVEALMVLNAWCLYEFPSGQPLSRDVHEIRAVLEGVLHQDDYSHHAGLCHLYVHLMEMSSSPELALDACRPLRSESPGAGHLVHMGTHIDILIGDYVSCIRYDWAATEADKQMMAYSPGTAELGTFYFNYVVHNYHMLVYGAILGGMEQQGMTAARALNEIVNETIFEEHPDLVTMLESYSAMDIHVMIRFGRWKELLELELPKNEELMIYRAASMHSARGLALAVTGMVAEAKHEADRLDELRSLPEAASSRILFNNSVDKLLDLEAVMLRGEIAYREQDYELAFSLLRQAVQLQDTLNYDEPWGKMQPIRHALGGLLLEQGAVDEATALFRQDLKLHPKNPFGLVGLIGCLKRSTSYCCSSNSSISGIDTELAELVAQLEKQRSHAWADFDVAVACECCKRL